MVTSDMNSSIKIAGILTQLEAKDICDVTKIMVITRRIHRMFINNE